MERSKGKHFFVPKFSITSPSLNFMTDLNEFVHENAQRDCDCICYSNELFFSFSVHNVV